MITITNSPQSDHVSAAVRAKNASVREREFFRSWPAEATDSEVKSVKGPHGVKGEVTHIEAFGSIYIAIAHRLSAFQCGSLPEHEHCTRDMPGHEHMKVAGNCPGGPAALDHTHDMVPDEHACCLVPEPFPVSVYYDVPVGYGLALPLGDNLIVNIKRADAGYVVD